MSVIARGWLAPGAIAKTLAVLVTVAGCGGGGDEPSPQEPPAVRGAVDLEKPRAGAPDAGTAAGHGNDGGVGTTGAAVFSFTGRVEPPGSAVAVSDGAVRVEPSGRFTVATASPERGTKRIELSATRPGHRPWRLDVRVVRGAPARVEVPERDDVAPSAAIVVQPGGGAEPVVQASPSRAGDDPEVIALREPSFSATGVVRDAEGGTGRIRLSMIATTRCGGGDARRKVDLRPPAQIVSVALPPGASAPAERSRTARYRLPVRDGCTVRGEVYAEGTDARGRQAVTHHVGFRFP